MGLHHISLCLSLSFSPSHTHAPQALALSGGVRVGVRVFVSARVVCGRWFGFCEDVRCFRNELPFGALSLVERITTGGCTEMMGRSRLTRRSCQEEEVKYVAGRGENGQVAPSLKYANGVLLVSHQYQYRGFGEHAPPVLRTAAATGCTWSSRHHPGANCGSTVSQQAATSCDKPMNGCISPP